MHVDPLDELDDLPAVELPDAAVSREAPQGGLGVRHQLRHLLAFALELEHRGARLADARGVGGCEQVVFVFADDARLEVLYEAVAEMQRSLLAPAGLVDALVHVRRALADELLSVIRGEPGGVDAHGDQRLGGLGDDPLQALLVEQVRAAAAFVALVGRAGEVAVPVAPRADQHLLAAFRAVDEAAEEGDPLRSGGGPGVPQHEVLDHLEFMAAHEGPVGSLLAEPLLPGAGKRLPAAEARRVGPALDHRARVYLVGQDSHDRVGAPFRPVSPGEGHGEPDAVLQLVQAGAGLAQAVELVGDGLGRHPLELHAEDLLDVGGGLPVGDEVPPLFGIVLVSVRGEGACALPALHLGVQPRARLHRRVAADVLVEHAAEREHDARRVGVARCGVVSLRYHDDADPPPAVHLGELLLQENAALDRVAPESARVLDDEAFDDARFQIGHERLPTLAVVCCARHAVVGVLAHDPQVLWASLAVLADDLLLVDDAAGYPVQVIAARQPGVASQAHRPVLCSGHKKSTLLRWVRATKHAPGESTKNVAVQLFFPQRRF